MCIRDRSRILREHLSRLDEAHQVIQRAIRLDPGEPSVIRGLLETQRLLSRDEEALETYERLHKIYETEGYEEPPADFKIAVGQLCETLGRPEKA